MKRGITHVEWAISMGLFLVALVFFFILLRPGVKPAYEQGALMSMVETNFKDYFIWHVKKTPLFIKALEVPPRVDEDRYVSVNAPSGWRFSKMEPDPYSGPLEYDFGEKKIYIRCKIGICETDDGPIIVYYYPSSESATQEETVLIANCNIEDEEKCDAELGSTENFEGVAKERLDRLKYKDVKKEWKYPESKDFAIYLDNSKVFDDGPEPGQQDNVFVKELRTWVLEQNGDRVNSVVGLRAW